MLRSLRIRPSVLSTLLFASLAVPLLPSCAGDQFGGESGGGDCIEASRTILGVDEELPLGFSAQDVLGFAATTFEIPFSLSLPPTDEYSGLELVPEGETTLTLTIESADEEVVLVDQEPDPNGNGGVDCFDYVEIDAELTLVTDNDAFDDTLPVVLRAPHAASADVTVNLDPGSMNGSFDLTENDELVVASITNPPEDWQLDRVPLELRFSPEHVFGRIGALYTATYPGDDVPFDALVTLWQLEDELAGACYEEDFGGPIDGGQAVSHFGELLTETPSLSIHFTSGGVSDLELEATFVPEAEFCLVPVSVPVLVVEGDVVLSRDGEPFATWGMQASTRYADDGELESIVLTAGAHLSQPFDADDVTSTLGDFGTDLTTHEEAAALVWLDWTATDGWHGELHLEADLQVLAQATVTEVE